jgi:hypothetical protein
LDVKNRFRVERLLADWMGVEEGDILIYCPDVEMSLKLADMNVSWKESIAKFKNITPGPIQSRVGFINQAHRHLWEFIVFVTDELANDAKKKVMLHDILHDLVSRNIPQGNNTCDRVLSSVLSSDFDSEIRLSEVQRNEVIEAFVQSPEAGRQNRQGLDLSRDALRSQIMRVSQGEG